MDTLESAAASAHDKAVRFHEHLDNASRKLNEAVGDVASAMSAIKADCAVVIQEMQALKQRIVNDEEELRQVSASVLDEIIALEHAIQMARSEGIAEAEPSVGELRELVVNFVATDEGFSTSSQQTIERLEIAAVAIETTGSSGSSRLASLEALVIASSQKISSASGELERKLNSFEEHIRNVLLSDAEAELVGTIEKFLRIKDDCTAHFAQQEQAVKDEVEQLINRVEQRLGDELEHVVSDGDGVARSIAMVGDSLSNSIADVMQVNATAKTSLSTASVGLESIASILQDLRDIFEKVA